MHATGKILVGCGAGCVRGGEGKILVGCGVGCARCSGEDSSGVHSSGVRRRVCAPGKILVGCNAGEDSSGVRCRVCAWRGRF